MIWWFRVGVEVSRRPGLWLTAIRAYRRMIPSDWYRVWPYLPVPDREYLDFRFHTAGGFDRLSPTEVIGYLDWLRAWPAAVRS